MYIVGLMSGTSLDGIDAALISIQNDGVDTELEVIDFLTLPFTEDIRAEIMASLANETSSVQLICSLNFKLGYLFADAVKAICRKNNLPLEQLDLIGSHGQTIYHQPAGSGKYIPSTLQIGEPAVIAYETGTKVISNFRTMDMAAGGQGAPLVPYTEYILYRSKTKNRLLQNIGGIANVTVIPRNAALEQVRAFDTGPGNMIIDEVCRQCFGVPFDQGGKLAKLGKVNEPLLKSLMNTPYIIATPPKSTGRELFGKTFVSTLLKGNSQLSDYDLLTTITMFTAKSIVENYQRFIFPDLKVDELILGGGGSYNHTLVTMIKDLVGMEVTVLTQEDIGLSSEAKEAIAFAILANETVNKNPSNVPGVTGARKPVILGNITLPS